MARHPQFDSVAFLILLVSLMGQTTLPQGEQIIPTAKWQEHVQLAGIEPDGWEIIPGSITVSPNKQRVAYKIQRGVGKAVVVDGKTSPVYLKIGKLTFSSNSHHLYYVARERGPWFITKNNGSKRPINEVVGDIAVSANGNQYAVAYKTPTRIRVRVNNEHGPLFDEVPMASFTYSANTKKHAYFGRKANQWYVQINDQTAGPFEELAGKPQFDAKSQTLAYIARIAEGWQVVQNNQPWRTALQIAGIQFHPVSSQLFAWLRTDSQQWQLYCDNKPIKEAFSSTPCSITFGNHPSQWATLLTQNGKTYLMRSGQRSETQGRILPESLQFDAKSIQLIYVTQTDQGQHLTVDGSLQQSYEAIQISDILISRNCKRIAYVAKRNGQWAVIDQGKPAQFVDQILPGSLALSPDQQQLVYLVQNGPIKYLYWNHKVVGEFEDITQPVFDRKGLHVAWAAQVNHQWHLYIDGQPNPTAFANLVGKPNISVYRGQFVAMILQANTVGPTFSTLAMQQVDRYNAMATVDPSSVR